jgi:predicted nucleotidyltransferase
MIFMYAVGIVAEFNPFHKGHAYLIAEARSRGASHIAVAMSGAAVQRGELALCSKHERAAAAIENGADLVVELPAPFSCAAAPWFADSAVQILGQLGINALAFGSEYESRELLLSAADCVFSLAESREVLKLVSDGFSYPAALQKAAAEQFGEQIAEVISSPNSTLAIEYILALRRHLPSADIIPVKRRGAAHDGAPESGFASGSYLRECILSGENTAEYIPEKSAPSAVCNPEIAEKIIYYNLLSADRERLLRLPEANAALADRILNAAKNPKPYLAEFLLDVKSRNFTLARIRRTALHLALGIEKSDIIPVPHIRILAFNKRGAEILRRAEPQIPVSTSLRELENSSVQSRRIVAIEQNAVRLMQIGMGNFENEYTKKIVIKK